MPEQDAYRVKRPDGQVKIFPPGTPDDVMTEWYQGGKAGGLGMLGMELPDNPGGLKGLGADIGKILEVIGGFTPARTIPLLAGMATSGIGSAMQGGDVTDIAAAAAGSGAVGAGGRLLSQGGTTLGLKLGGHLPNAAEMSASRTPTWDLAGDFYDLRASRPTGIGSGRAIQRQVDKTGAELGKAEEMAKPVTLRSFSKDAPANVKQRSLQARGGFPESFGRGLDDAQRKFLREQLINKGWSKNLIDSLDDAGLESISGITDVPMRNVGGIKQDMQKRGEDVLNARNDRTTTAPRIQAGAQHADEIARQARQAQRNDPNVEKALNRSGRAQRVRAANDDVTTRSSLPNLIRQHGLSLGAIASGTIGNPKLASQAGIASDALLRAIVGLFRSGDDK